MGITVAQDAALSMTKNTEARQETVHKNAIANMSKAGRRKIAKVHCTDTPSYITKEKNSQPTWKCWETASVILLRDHIKQEV